MDFSGLSLIKVNYQTVFKPFDCGDPDLNDFLLNKSKDFALQLLATTYILENEERIIAFFSIFNDSVRLEDIEFASKSAIKRLLSGFLPHPKRHLKYFPALKIGRLATCNQTQKRGIGTAVINFIIDYALKQNEQCACKFITVDAYAASLEFYEKKGFEYFTKDDKAVDTRQMFYDLTPLINTAQTLEDT